MSRVIEIRPFRGGFQCLEAEGVALLAWRTGKAGCDRLRRCLGKVKCRPSTPRGTNSCKRSLPRLGDSRRGENPM